MHRRLRIALIGPTSLTWEEIAAEVEPDLARLARSGVELSYVITGDGPPSITTEEDERARHRLPGPERPRAGGTRADHEPHDDGSPGGGGQLASTVFWSSTCGCFAA